MLIDGETIVNIDPKEIVSTTKQIVEEATLDKVSQELLSTFEKIEGEIVVENAPQEPVPTTKQIKERVTVDIIPQELVSIVIVQMEREVVIGTDPQEIISIPEKVGGDYGLKTTTRRIY